MTGARQDVYARLLGQAAREAAEFERAELPREPRLRLAILTCMDARMDVEQLLGLAAGDANILRNAGAVASDDAIRSLILSQQLLGTDEVIVLGHTGCGLHDLADAELRAQLARSTGRRSDVHFGAFHDLEAHVRAQVERLTRHPWIRRVPVHGLIYEVETGRVRELE